MNDQRDVNADEAAAQALQAQMWMADDDNDDGHLNARALEFMPENIRRLLLDRRHDLGQDALGANEEEQGNEGGGIGLGGGADAGEDLDAIDGGVAGDVFDDQKNKITKSVKCPLVLYFECDEDLDDLSPNNFLLKRGVTVYIGLDKNTKLIHVFQQYCNFVNSRASKKLFYNAPELKPSDFEFVHCTVLDPSHTVEASAMMKNDRVKVRRERSKELSSKAELFRQQRESDRKYFKDLRQLMSNSPECMGCDVVLDCRGKVVDGNGYSQNVLATTVRGHSVLLSKRCKWLGQKIYYAREELIRRAEITVPSDAEKSEQNEDQGMSAEVQSESESVAVGNNETLKSSQSDDEDDVVPSYPVHNDGGELHSHVAEVLDDEDEDDDIPLPEETFERNIKSHSSSHTLPSNSHSLVWVTLDHSPEAVKILMEYCYTNRVLSLGHEAFTKASTHADPKDVGTLEAKNSSPVPPFRKHEWPNGGLPTISLHVALAGIALAEESHMPRLSLMCEVAASQLVDHKNVIDVLSACQIQQQKTGNRLPLLRKAAMLDCVMARGSSGIDKLYANLSFKANLEERSALVIPSLLEGTVEILPPTMKTKEWLKKKEKMDSETSNLFKQLDDSDQQRRALERIQWRSQAMVKRRVEVAFGPDDLQLKLPPTVTSRDQLSYRDRGTKRKGRSGTPTANFDWNRGVIARHVRRKRDP